VTIFPGLTSKKLHVHIVAHSHCKSITWLHDILGSNCNYSTEVHNYKALITELQIKATARGETTITITEQKTVIIT